MGRLVAKADPLDLDALAAKLAPLVIARLALALGATASPYSTRRGHEPPEFTSRAKVWRATAPTIPGAVRFGRWWTVSREAYATWIRAQGGNAAPIPAPAANEWTPSAALASVGLRATRSR